MHLHERFWTISRGCVSTGATGAMAPVNFEKAYLALAKFLKYVTEGALAQVPLVLCDKVWHLCFHISNAPSVKLSSKGIASAWQYF